jgi:hypothetical protein
MAVKNGAVANDGAMATVLSLEGAVEILPVSAFIG